MKIPARRVPEALTRLLELFHGEREGGETALSFFKRVEINRVKEALADIAALDGTGLDSDDYKDLGSDLPFKVETSEGECAS